MQRTYACDIIALKRQGQCDSFEPRKIDNKRRDSSRPLKSRQTAFLPGRDSSRPGNSYVSQSCLIAKFWLVFVLLHVQICNCVPFDDEPPARSIHLPLPLPTILKSRASLDELLLDIDQS